MLTGQISRKQEFTPMSQGAVDDQNKKKGMRTIVQSPRVNQTSGFFFFLWWERAGVIGVVARMAGGRFQDARGKLALHREASKVYRGAWALCTARHGHCGVECQIVWVRERQGGNGEKENCSWIISVYIANWWPLLINQATVPDRSLCGPSVRGYKWRSKRGEG